MNIMKLFQQSYHFLRKEHNIRHNNVINKMHHDAYSEVLKIDWFNYIF